ncbi:MAG: PAS domain S-box protein [Methylocystis sp.]|nr:PAS domain S-box protein [Methylocystis sp.]
MTGKDKTPRRDNSSKAAKPFPTVGIGTSAGGVHALQEFFQALPDDVEAAFVIIVHLDPTRQSELSQILQARTKMTVTEVKGRVPLEPKHVYVIPPDRKLLIADQHVSTAEFDEPRWHRAPIDLFFRSLAAQHGEDFAIVLSGAGSDGAVGVKAVKEAGGIILVQDPQEAEYGSMPHSAVATGLADFVLPVREIAERLPELIRDKGSAPTEPLGEQDEDAMRRILFHLRARTGHDFSKYKKSTIQRRIARRMQVRRAANLVDYFTVLRENVEEAQALFADLLISVTTFFRDPASFEKLARLVIAKLFEQKDAADAIRVWVPGCATGEEAYSIAILLLEEAGRHDIHPEIQVFASDLDGAALATAREGRYPLAVEADVSEERLRRFFTRESDHYRVKRELRDIVLFATHSLLKDPPFSRLDLVSCRNLLIYLDRELQQQTCVTLHYGLRAGGYLFLGSSETADNPPGLFRAVNREARIYQSTPARVDRAPVIQRLAAAPLGMEPPVRPAVPVRARSETATHREALERLAPPSVVVDESYRIIHLSETAGRFLQPSSGPLPSDIAELAREELRFDLRAALHRAFARGEPSLSAPIPVRFNGDRRRVYFQVKPFADDPQARRLALVLFIEGEAFDAALAERVDIEGRAPDEAVRQLQQELQLTQSRLRTSREEYEGANEELRAANEELQSINEEYRSTAEELETSKEELQSLNEELQTVNSELKTKLEGVSRDHSDIQNLMAATDVGILFLDPQLRIKRFTPPIAGLVSIAAGDEGRPITDFAHSLDYESLAEDARRVLDTLVSIEREVRSRSGRWHIMRLRPYRTVEARVDGVVVTFVDISERRRAEESLRASETRLRAVVEGAKDAIITVDEAGIIQSLNKATVATFGYETDEIIGQNVSMLMPEPNRSRHDGYIQNYLRTGEAKIIGIGREVEGLRKNGTVFPMELTVSEAHYDDHRLFVGFARDLSDKRKIEARVQRLHAERLDAMGGMATAMAHEINQPLSASATYLKTARRLLDKPPEQRAVSVDKILDNAAAQIMRAGRIVGHMREFVAHGEPDKTLHSLHDLIKQTYDLTNADIEQADVGVTLRLNADDDHVLADPVQIKQLLTNLTRNAVEAMQGSKKRELLISTSSVEKDMIRVDLADTGVGLSADIEADLFEPFTTTKASGMGVGLSISRWIVEAHYGKIWVEPNPGGGAVFSFTLPLAKAEIGP